MTFFNEQKLQSKIKTEILLKYFGAWTRIMKSRTSTNRIAYIDLFSGPGNYEDGEKSTPIQILEYCVNDDDLADKVVTIFNDKNEDNIITLKENIAGIEGIESLEYEPKFFCGEVGKEIVEVFQRTAMVPTLAFVDPFGYKGLTCDLIQSLIKDFGSDCLFFFNFNRVRMGVNNQLVDIHMKGLFGENRHEEMKEILPYLNPEEKEVYILDKLAESLSNNNQNFVLPFKFIHEKKDMTSHYLIFVTKHPLGYSIMKDIMHKSSSIKDNGVANYSYIPTAHMQKYENIQLSILDEYQTDFDKLLHRLPIQYSGRQLRLIDLYEEDHLHKPYIKANYKEAIRILEEKGLVDVIPRASDRQIRKGVLTVADKVTITFPNISSR